MGRGGLEGRIGDGDGDGEVSVVSWVRGSIGEIGDVGDVGGGVDVLVMLEVA